MSDAAIAEPMPPYTITAEAGCCAGLRPGRRAWLALDSADRTGSVVIAERWAGGVGLPSGAQAEWVRDAVPALLESYQALEDSKDGAWCSLDHWIEEGFRRDGQPTEVTANEAVDGWINAFGTQDAAEYLHTIASGQSDGSDLAREGWYQLVPGEDVRAAAVAWLREQADSVDSLAPVARSEEALVMIDRLLELGEDLDPEEGVGAYRLAEAAAKHLSVDPVVRELWGRLRLDSLHEGVADEDTRVFLPMEAPVWARVRGS